MATVTPESLRAELAASRAALLKAIAGVTEQQFKKRPVTAAEDEAWSIAEVLAHLLWAEKLRSSWIRAALREPEAAAASPARGEREAAARAGRLAPVPQLIHGLLATRRELEKLVDEALTTEGGGELSVRVRGRKPEALARVVSRLVIGHEARHAEQIEALRVEVGAGRSVT
jgi:DinB superfamily